MMPRKYTDLFCDEVAHVNRSVYLGSGQVKTMKEPGENHDFYGNNNGCRVEPYVGCS